MTWAQKALDVGVVGGLGIRMGVAEGDDDEIEGEEEMRLLLANAERHWSWNRRR